MGLRDRSLPMADRTLLEDDLPSSIARRWRSDVRGDANCEIGDRSTACRRGRDADRIGKLAACPTRLIGGASSPDQAIAQCLPRYGAGHRHDSPTTVSEEEATRRPPSDPKWSAGPHTPIGAGRGDRSLPRYRFRVVHALKALHVQPWQVATLREHPSTRLRRFQRPAKRPATPRESRRHSAGVQKDRGTR
jgi:hypothetical protein